MDCESDIVTLRNETFREVLGVVVVPPQIVPKERNRELVEMAYNFSMLHHPLNSRPIPMHYSAGILARRLRAAQVFW